MKAVLLPLSWAYGYVMSLRNELFDGGIFRPYRSSLPVISIGNFSVGGNAKTPLVIFLAQELSKRGIDCAILSRGYGGRLAGPLLVQPQHSAAEVGDEPLLIAAKTGRPVVVARKRSLGAKLIEREGLGSVILLDDGFQHRWLGRDLDIVTAYVGSEGARKDFMDGRLLPFGRFREYRDHALRRTDVLIFSERVPAAESADIEPRLFRLVPPGVQLYRSFFEVQGAYSVHGGARLQPQPVIAVCGIANPEGFIETLNRSGYAVAESYRFADHYQFKAGELQGIRDKHPGLPLVCTEKDSLRVPAAERQGMHELRIAAKVAPGDAFVTQVCRAIVQKEQRRKGTVVDLAGSGEAAKSSKEGL